MVILGLDISTTVTGVTILENGNIIFCDHIQLEPTSKKEPDRDLLDKGLMIEEYLTVLKSKFDIDKIWVEDKLSGYSGGGTNAHTMAVLIAFHQITCWIIMKIWRCKPLKINVSTARKAVTGQGKAKKGQDIKVVMLSWVIKKFPDFQVDLNRNGNVHEYIFDRSDSTIIAYYGHLISIKSKI
jgi:Holliday junction resolvasome RuvABC endonuclease subunit